MASNRSNYLFHPDVIDAFPMVQNFPTPPGAGATIFYSPLPGLNGGNATESAVTIALPYSGTIQNLTVGTNGAQPGSGSLTVTVRVGTAWPAVGMANTVLKVVIPTSGSAGLYSDKTDSVVYTAGQPISISAVNAASATAAQISHIFLELIGAH